MEELSSGERRAPLDVFDLWLVIEAYKLLNQLFVESDMEKILLNFGCSLFSTDC